MRIISKVKDFYDYVGEQYGPSDPKEVWTRESYKVKDAPKALVSDYGRWDPHLGLSFAGNEIVKYFDNKKDPTSAIFTDILLVGENPFLLQMRSSFGALPFWKVATPKDFAQYHLYHQPWDKRGNPLWKPSTKAIKKILQEIGQPCVVLTVSDPHLQKPSYFVPTLKDIEGFPGRAMTSQQTYQEIHSALINICRTNPDTVVPVEISNNSKIEKAGFDLKTSFRNPIKLDKLSKSK